jgi:predicted nucleic acid-binding protein
MKVLVDTNVVLDVLLDREPFAAPAVELLSRIELGEIEGCLCATSITTIHYLATKTVGARRALLAIRNLMGMFEIAPVNRPVLAAALESPFADFEDAVAHEAARQMSAEAIVTRNPRDFKKAALPIWSPGQLCQMLDLRERDNG